MYPVKERAAKLLAVGESIEDVAKAVKKKEETVKLWQLDKDFARAIDGHCQVILESAAGVAIQVAVGYLAKKHADKDRAMVALALLRMNKPVSPPRNGGRKPVSEDETDTDRYSIEQLKRLTGDA